MKYLSLFSGVEAATLAWDSLGWEPVAFCEFDEFPSAVLNKHWPEVPNFGDVTKITEKQIKSLGKIDIVVFGSPCQGLSIAGQQEGLNDERSGLFRDAIRIINLCRKHCGTRFALWENVPGAFSCNRGGDFAEVLKLLSGTKFDSQKWQTSGVAIGAQGLVEWATLDAQYFGVPQRRRRVFALADFGNWLDRSQILFEPKSLSGDFEQSRETGQGFTSKAKNSIKSSSHWDNELGAHPTLNQSHNSGGIALSNQELFSQRGAGLVSAIHQNTRGEVRLTDVSPTIQTEGGTVGQGYQAVFTHPERIANVLTARSHKGINSDLNEGQSLVVACNPNQVRKLTPIECERLQGMPDNHTRVSWKGKPEEECPDGLRYKAIGNSMAVPVMKWIGQRIDLVINN